MTTRRRLLATLGAASLAGCLTGSNGGNGDVEKATGPVTTAPLPSSPGDHTYATMGSDDAPVVTYFGNWKCPYCAQFSAGTSDEVLPLGTIVTDYVEPGDVSLVYRGFSYTSDGDPFLGTDSPAAARAGLAVWNTDPETYWTFHETVMANQPPESETWATAGRLVSFAEAAGVSDTDPVRKAVKSGTYDDVVRATTDAAAKAGVRGTPSLIVDGSLYSPFKPSELRSALDALVG